MVLHSNVETALLADIICSYINFKCFYLALVVC